MRYGTFLFAEGKRDEARQIRDQIAGYPACSWDELPAMGFNCLHNTDQTGMVFRGEIELIKVDADRVFLKLKWIKVLQPVFDEDGDIDQYKMKWEPWRVTETSFSRKITPHLTPEGSVIIQDWLIGEEYFTTNTLSKVEGFTEE